jgi:hypothetical protein
VPSGSQQIKGLQKNDLRYPLKKQADMALVMSPWDCYRVPFETAFHLLCVCFVERDSYLLEIFCTKMAGN